MDAAELATLAQLIGAIRDLVDRLQHLVEHGGDPTSVTSQIQSLGMRIGSLTFSVQQREVVSWDRPHSHPARHPPLTRLTTPAIDPRMVKHCAPYRPPEPGPAPPLSGTWQMDRYHPGRTSV